MKRLMILAATLCFGVAASCTKEPEPVKMVEYTLTAGLDTNATKTYSSGTAVYWSKGDKLDLYNFSSKASYAIQRVEETAGHSSATFSGTIAEGFTPQYAVYPAGNNSISGSTITSTPYESYIFDGSNENSLAKGMNLSMGKIENGGVKMKNAMGLMKFIFVAPKDGNSLITKRLEAYVYTHSTTNTADPILGRINLGWDNDSERPTVALASGNNNSNMLTAKPRLVEKEGSDNTFIVEVLPKTYNGLRIILKNTQTNVQSAYFTNTQFTVDQNKIKTLGTFSIPDDAYTISQTFTGSNLFNCAKNAGNLSKDTEIKNWGEITTTSYSYTQEIDDKEYKWTIDGKCFYNTNAKVLQLKDVAYLGIPAVDGYKATAVVMYTKNSMNNGKSYTVYSYSKADNTYNQYTAKNGNPLPAQYCWLNYPCIFPLTNSSANTQYFIATGSTNAQITKVEVTYVPVSES